MKANSNKIGNILNLTRLSKGDGKGWAWDVVERNIRDDEYVYDLVEYSTNDIGEGLWRTERSGLTGYMEDRQISGTSQFGTAYGSQKRSAIRQRLVRYFAEEE